MDIMALPLGWPRRKRSLERGRGQRKQHPQTHSRPRLEVLEDRTLPSVLMVTNINDSGPGSLRAQIAKADAGDTIKFAASLTGQTITLTSGEIAFDIGLDIEGPGATKLAISGNKASRILDIGPDASPVTIAGLTLRNGLANLDQGGAIFDDGSSLTLQSDTLSSDQATLDGGALAVLGESTAGMTVTITNSRFVNDAVTGSPGFISGITNFPGGDSQGGAIYLNAQYSAGLVLTVSGTSFTSDSATGGAGVNGVVGSASYGGNGGAAQGGAVLIDAGVAAQPLFSFATDTFSKCSATGGSAGNGVSGDVGGTGGEADGGALAYTAHLAASPTLNVATCTFTSNTAKGGNAGSGGDAVATAATVTTGGDGGTGGKAEGGAGFADFQDSAAGSDTFTADVFYGNRALGGRGGTGGTGADGGTAGAGGLATGGGLSIISSDLAASTHLTIAQSSINSNIAQGGNGGVGGIGSVSGGDGGFGNHAFGGGLYLQGTFAATDTWTLNGDSVAYNEAFSGNGGAGGAGIISGGNGGDALNSAGGGVWVRFLDLDILNSTIIYNSVFDGQGGSGGSGSIPGSTGFSDPGNGGGLFVALGTACANNSIILNNQADFYSNANVVLGPC
jgi:hypothetical protein